MEKLYIYIIIGVVANILIPLSIVILVKKKNPKINIDSDYILNLINILGGKENILKYSVENARVKFNVSNLDKVDLEKLKELSPKGVFVTENDVKTLFKYESNEIILMLNKILK